MRNLHNGQYTGTPFLVSHCIQLHTILTHSTMYVRTRLCGFLDARLDSKPVTLSTCFRFALCTISVSNPSSCGRLQCPLSVQDHPASVRIIKHCAARAGSNGMCCIQFTTACPFSALQPQRYSSSQSARIHRNYPSSENQYHKNNDDTTDL